MNNRGMVRGPLIASTISSVLAVACGLEPAQTTAAPRPQGSRGVATMTEAVQLVSEGQELDYRAPQQSIRSARKDVATRKLVEACLDGTPAGCWRVWGREASGRYGGSIHAAAMQAGRNCLAGDKLTCIALGGNLADGMLDVHEHDAALVMDACGNGELRGCSRSETARRCMLADRASDECDDVVKDASIQSAAILVRRLCARGLGAACRVLGRHGQLVGVSDAEREAFSRRACELRDPEGCTLAIEVARARNEMGEVGYLETQRSAHRRVACHNGEPEACIRSDDSLAESTASRACQSGLLMACPHGHAAADLELICSSIGFECDELSKERSPFSIGSRNALEHGCQFGRQDLCVELIHGYREKRWPEPVAGRADGLLRWVCSLSERERWLRGETCPAPPTP